MARLTAASKNQPLSSIEGGGKRATPGGKMNPLLALLRRNSSSSSNQQQNKQGRSGRLGKSVSVLDRLTASSEQLDKTGGFEGVPGGGSRITPVALTGVKSLGRRGLSLDRLGLNDSGEKKKSASESNLLNTSGSSEAELQVGPDGSDLPPGVKPPGGETFPAPPGEAELARLSMSATLETVGGEGFYRSFDDLDDIGNYPLIILISLLSNKNLLIDDHLMAGVLADSNPLEAAVVLRGDKEVCNGSSNGSQNGHCNGGRNSFNSSDSGRMSDTYAETSNSSVASSTSAIGGGCQANRLNSSNLSNCSGERTMC